MQPSPTIERLHRPLALAVIFCLESILDEKRSADKVLEYCFKNNPAFGKRDRAFIASNVYDIIRHKILIEFCIQPNYSKWALLGGWLLIQGWSLPDWYEFEKLNASQIKKLFATGKKSPKVLYSIPDALNTLGLAQLPADKWLMEMEALHRSAPMVLRVNTLKTRIEKVTSFLANNDIEYKTFNDDHSESIQIIKRVNIFTSDLFKNGEVEVQDYASQQVAWFADPKPGQKVIDACAGAGGKSLHLAARMKNKGRIVAMDVEPFKLETLKKRAKRAGVDIIETKWIENNKTVKRLASQADKLILDVPCTGSGVLKRNPEAKYRIDQKFLDEVKNKQQNILDQYHTMVKPGGELIYITCSIFPEENNLQVQSFLQRQPEFTLQAESQLWPSEFGYDGFYMARLLKTSLIK